MCNITLRRVRSTIVAVQMQLECVYVTIGIFFFFNRPAQLSLSILSRKVFTECRYQRHVKTQLGGPVTRTFQLPPPGVPHV